jgi:hypothetical protein
MLRSGERRNKAANRTPGAPQVHGVGQQPDQVGARSTAKGAAGRSVLLLLDEAHLTVE